MTSPHPRPLVVFDLDGTIVDSRLDLADSTNELLGEFGARPLAVDRVAGLVGDGARALVERALEAAGLAAATPGALDRFLAIYDRRLLVHTRPYPGIAAVIHAAATRAPLAIVTNKPEAPTHRILDAFGLGPAFWRVIGGDAGLPRKPDPAALNRLMAEASATPTSTLMIGDSMVDVETARRAGVAVCVAGYGFGRARGAMTLRAGERVADTPAAVGIAIDRFLDRIE